ncbi:helix-turn-helix domain-containing protein [Streptococcus uberis]|uniref:helix-turn-helix domain-containing protein n=1 Tax=Streptococcus uberis TaxID=1349 RepID=UPI00193AA3A6|nr:helix-turn-helix transcriptional regulator [Streptococcus uberis]
MLVLSYKKLFKKLIDLDMQHNELMEKANVSRSTFYKLKNGENVNTEVLIKICNALNCDISEIMECVEN